jgi:hypothetical protein
MIFWTDGQENSTRERNVKLTWDYLKQMVTYLNSKNIPCTANLFDHSPTQIIEDATHDPYPLGVYKRAEKLNKAIYSLPDDDFICLMDCDVFIHKKHWDNLGKLLQNMAYDIGYFFNFAKLESGGEIDDLDVAIGYNYTLAFTKGYTGGFGGFCLNSIKAIKDVGAYDTKFTTWGGEDGDLMDRYNTSRKFRCIGISDEEILPYHLPHFEDRENILYFNREEYVRNNPV